MCHKSAAKWAAKNVAKLHTHLIAIQVLLPLVMVIQENHEN